MQSNVYDIVVMADSLIGTTNYLQLAIYTLIAFAVLLFVNFKKKKQQLTSIKRFNDLLSRQNYDLEFANKELVGSVKENWKITNVLAHDLRSSIVGVDMLIKSIEKKRPVEIPYRILVLQGIIGQYCRWVILNVLEGNTETIFVKLSWIEVYNSFQAVLLQLKPKLKEKELTVNLEMTDIKLESYPERLEKVFTLAMTVVIECSGAGDTIDINYFFADHQPVIIFKNRKILIQPDMAQPFGLEIENTLELNQNKLKILEKIMGDAIAEKDNEGMLLFEDRFSIGMIAKIYDPKFYFYYCV